MILRPSPARWFALAAAAGIAATAFACNDGRSASGSDTAAASSQEADTAATDTAATETPTPTDDATTAETTVTDETAADASDTDSDTTTPALALGPCTVTVEDIAVETRAYTYDSHGRKIASVLTTPEVATPIGSESWTYDEAGTLREFRESHRRAALGRVDDDHAQVWNAAGKLTHEEWDTDGDGTLDMWKQIDFDADGCSHVASGVDYSGAYRTVSKCNASGDVIHWELDRDGDGAADASSDMAYRADHRLLGEIDRAEGIYEARSWTYTDADDGTLHGHCDIDWSDDEDPSPNEIVETIWDPRMTHVFPEVADYFEVGEVLARVDRDTDGTWDSEDSFTFDGTVYHARIERGERIDEWLFGADYRLRRHTTGTGGDSDLLDTFTYSDDGDLLVAETDNDRDGVPEAVTTYTYDASHRVLSEVFVRAGQTYRTTTYEYDSCH